MRFLGLIKINRKLFPSFGIIILPFVQRGIILDSKLLEKKQ